MLLGAAQDAVKHDQDVLIYQINTAIFDVINDSDIAVIDKNTRSRIVNACLNDKYCKNGDYTQDYLQRLVMDELAEVGYRIRYNHRQRSY